jgi:hypothetical protein
MQFLCLATKDDLNEMHVITAFRLWRIAQESIVN